MFLKNYSYVQTALVLGTNSPSFTTLMSEVKSVGGTKFGDIATTGYSRTCRPSSILSLTDGNIISSLGDKIGSHKPYGVVFGTSNQQPTYEDYTMSGNIIDMTNVAKTVTTNETIENNDIVREIVFTLVNNKTEDITVGEVGLCDYFGYDTSKNLSTFYGYGYLVERTALEQPITIPANGGVGQITYTIRINYQTA